MDDAQSKSRKNKISYPKEQTRLLHRRKSQVSIELVRGKSSKLVVALATAWPLVCVLLKVFSVVVFAIYLYSTATTITSPKLQLKAIYPIKHMHSN